MFYVVAPCILFDLAFSLGLVLNNQYGSKGNAETEELLPRI